MVPGGQGILATTPCPVLGQEMSNMTSGLQYSTLTLGSLEEGGNRSSSPVPRRPTGVWARGGPGAPVEEVAVVVVTNLLVPVLTAVKVTVVVGRVVVLVAVVVVSM